ncbi:MAG: hypothetical protein K2X93_01730 [Candidatus Obscuribacterales bacterium]|nr:hypothetical protein [Candidatus Obscuribacterales bacterium]
MRDCKTNGKLFLKDHLGLTGMQVSLNLFPAGASMPFYHQQNEELYIFTRGEGQIQLDNETFDVEVHSRSHCTCL